MVTSVALSLAQAWMLQASRGMLGRPADPKTRSVCTATRHPAA
jgi:hypothetical protein